MISHRLSTTKDADRIYYMEHGKIIEEGTHNELMLKNNKYAELFCLQADSYSYSGLTGRNFETV
jgi:ATP-binding cassette subfamily B protein